LSSGRAFPFFRRLIWRLGRKLYTWARGDLTNDPRSNGEYWLLRQVRKACSNPQVLFDVGANKGDWSAYALALPNVAEGITIHAFEPSLATHSLLADRFKECPAVTVHAYALSDHEGEGRFYSIADGAGTNSLSPISGSNVEVARLITIDGFLRQSGLESVSMVKIDTEGFDLLVLRGAEQALREGRIDIVQFEYNWRWLVNHACLRDVFDLISDKPYRLGKLARKTVEVYDQWHFELDRYFEGNYVLIRNGLDFEIARSYMHFDDSNTASSN
jgi:FkbM family methyltransferase